MSRRRKVHAVDRLNLILQHNRLRLCINDGRDEYQEFGFFFIIDEDSGEIVRRSVNLHELGYCLRVGGTLPPEKRVLPAGLHIHRKMSVAAKPVGSVPRNVPSCETPKATKR